MYTLENIQDELKSKERKVKDLIRYIKTRTDDNPNYSLLIGAGCSITSGIQSATSLIDTWKKEIFESEKSDLDTDMNVFFNKSTWFNERNSYSSLFEKRYDLARQRRMFVEQEVGDKTPSIGYAYLIKLIESRYFNTIFTTNFDDLLNESFYLFSNKRPLLCSHDSAISSITVTSKRPKIIKLHGDYLFDDIKSTLRETESLEENIKNKFIEFAKDYGLIVVGYAGNDRSIVDILTYLLKNEEYFKHGIYWCLKDGAEICDELRKLLWKDRVYYVKIDGFDELMAELNADLNDGSLPIDNNILNENKQSLIKKIVENKYIQKTSSSIIKSDIITLEKSTERKIIDSFYDYMRQKEDKETSNKEDGFIKKNDESNLSESEKEILNSIQKESFADNYNAALDIIDKNLVINLNSTYNIRLYRNKISCLLNLKRKEDAILICKELISFDKHIRNYIQISNIVENNKEKISYLDEAINIDPNYSKLYKNKAKAMIDEYNSSIDKDSLGWKLNDILDIVDKSIEVNPSLGNDAWVLKNSLIDKIYKGNTEELIKQKDSLLGKYICQDPFFPDVIEASVSIKELKKETDIEIIKYINKAIEISEKLNSYEQIKGNYIVLLNYLVKTKRRDDIKQMFNKIESIYVLDNEFLIIKSKVWAEEFDKINESIKILENIKSDNLQIYRELVKYYSYLNEYDKAESLFKTYFPNDKYIELQILENRNDYDQILKITRELKENNPNDENLIVQESYALLKLGKYEETYNYLSKMLKYSNFTDGVLLVNYWLAAKALNHNVKNDTIEQKIFNSPIEHSDLVKSASYALLKNKDKMLNFLKKEIQSDFTTKYRVREWIVFQQYKDDPSFKKTVGLI